MIKPNFNCQYAIPLSTDLGFLAAVIEVLLDAGAKLSVGELSGRVAWPTDKVVSDLGKAVKGDKKNVPEVSETNSNKGSDKVSKAQGKKSSKPNKECEQTCGMLGTGLNEEDYDLEIEVNSGEISIDKITYQVVDTNDFSIQKINQFDVDQKVYEALEVGKARVIIEFKEGNAKDNQDAMLSGMVVMALLEKLIIRTFFNSPT